MKKILYFLLVVATIPFFTSCDLETEPTDRVSGSTIFKDAKSAETAINGCYRALYTSGWSTSWSTENCGQMSIELAADLMAEDHLMYSQGQGWYYEDYRLNVHGDYSNKSGRPYSFWNFYYTIISNLNYITASESSMGGDPDLRDEIVGQAYALRAYSYFYLIQLYQQYYKNNESAPGVPLYIEPTKAGTIGAPRGTVAQVYAQIDKDIDYAITLLGKNKKQSHKSHIDYYVAQGIKARVCLNEQNWDGAIAAATESLKQPGLRLCTVEEMKGCNDISTPNVMWGVGIISDQSSIFASFFSHMDADGYKIVDGKAKPYYAYQAQQCISAGLYKLMDNGDSRKQNWWRGKLAAEGKGSSVSYCQLKFKWKNMDSGTGDYILMRSEEMVLIKAEAECHKKLYGIARTTISQLGSLRNENYETVLAKCADSDTYNKDTNAAILTLMDEILLERRVELWGEYGRIFDLQRLGLGYNRKYTGSNHTEMVQSKNTNAESPLFILPLPQSEIDGNESISAGDQNPIVQ